MKLNRIIIIALVLALAVVIPAGAQLGDTDVSSFTVQNVSNTNADVIVTFIGEDGTSYTPAQLDAGGSITNPFTLAPGQAKQVYVPNIPSGMLPSGRYSLVISSNAPIVAQAGLGGTGAIRFSGSYSSFSEGAGTYYIPTVAYNFFGWYSMITVQNLGTTTTDVTVTMTCTGGNSVGLQGTLTKTGLPPHASHTWALKNGIPAGFNAGTVCDGSAVVVSSDTAVVAVNNQNHPATGATNTFEGSSTGADKLYVTSLSNNFFGWNSALTILKLDPGNTTVTINYGGTWTDDTCTLTDAAPSCKLYIPAFVESTGRNGAVVTSSNGAKLLAVIGTTNGSLSNAVRAIASATGEVAIPNVTKNYFGYVSAITCQNVGATPTTINVEYSGYAANAYNHPTTLNDGDSLQIYVPTESFLPNGFQGGATIKANAVGADIACIVGNTGSGGPGDWTVAYNAYNK